eukprot:757940-Hanusia_phi.AAC.1
MYISGWEGMRRVGGGEGGGKKKGRGRDRRRREEGREHVVVVQVQGGAREVHYSTSLLDDGREPWKAFS